MATEWNARTGQTLVGRDFIAFEAMPLDAWRRAMLAFVDDCESHGKRPAIAWLRNQIGQWTGPPPKPSPLRRRGPAPLPDRSVYDVPEPEWMRDEPATSQSA